MTKEEIQLFLYRTMRQEIPLHKFELWLYECDELEHIIGNKLYFEFLSINFRDKYAFHNAEKLIRKTINTADCEENRIVQILTRLIEIESEQIAEAAEDIYGEYCKGYSFFRFIALVYITTADYDERGIYPNENEIRPFMEKFRQEAKRLLMHIKKKEILITDEWTYTDLRQSEDRIEEHSLEMM